MSNVRSRSINLNGKRDNIQGSLAPTLSPRKTLSLLKRSGAKVFNGCVKRVVHNLKSVEKGGFKDIL